MQPISTDSGDLLFFGYLENSAIVSKWGAGEYDKFYSMRRMGAQKVSDV